MFSMNFLWEENGRVIRYHLKGIIYYFLIIIRWHGTDNLNLNFSRKIVENIKIWFKKSDFGLLKLLSFPNDTYIEKIRSKIVCLWVTLTALLTCTINILQFNPNKWFLWIFLIFPANCCGDSSIRRLFKILSAKQIIEKEAPMSFLFAHYEPKQHCTKNKIYLYIWYLKPFSFEHVITELILNLLLNENPFFYIMPNNVK